MGTTNLGYFLNPFGGDMGSGGTIGLVPAPPAGSAAGNEFLSASGSWAAIGASYRPVSNVIAYVNTNTALTGLTTVLNSAGTTITLTNGENVCLSNQTTALQNARYTFNSGNLTLASDCNTGSNQQDTLFFETSTGNQYGIISPTPIIVGTDVLNFTLFSKNQNYTADEVTLHLSAGNVFSILNGGVNTSQLADNAVVYAKFQQVAASSLVGNATGSLASATGITLGTSLAFSGSSVNAIQDIRTSASPTFVGVLGSGQSSFGTTSVDSNSTMAVVNTALGIGVIHKGTVTGTAGGFQASVFDQQVFAPTSGSTLSSSFYSTPTFNVPSGQSVGVGASYTAMISQVGSSAGTLNNAIGFYIQAGGGFNGTVVNAYGGYFDDCPAGTSGASTAIYAKNMSVGDSGLNLRGTNDLHVSGRTVTSTFQLTTGAAASSVLTGDGSGVGSWSTGPTLASLTVTGNLIVDGQTAFGTGTPFAFAQSTFANTNAYPFGLYIAGTATNSTGGTQASFLGSQTFSPTTGSTNSFSFYSSSVMAAPSGQLISTAAGFGTNLSASSNVGTITNLMGFFGSTGGTIAGTVTNVYTAYFSDVPSGSSTGATSLYAANASIGYSGQNLRGTNNLLVAGQVAIGLSSVPTNVQFTVLNGSLPFGIYVEGTVTGGGGSNQASYLASQTFSPTTGSSISASFYSSPNFGAPSGQTISTAAGMVTTMNASANVGTISNIVGFYVQGSGSSFSGSVGNAWGGYFNSPPAGSSGANLALYADNMAIGYSSAALHGTNNLLVQGQSAFGQSTVDANSTVVINDGSKAFSVMTTGSMTNTSSGIQASFFASQVFAPTAGVSTAAAFYSSSYWGAPSGQTITNASNFLTFLNGSLNVGTITNLYGFHGQGGSTIAGTVSNVYMAYFDDTPSGAVTGSISLFAANASIGYSSVNLHGTNNFLVAGQTAFGISSVDSIATTTVTTTTLSVGESFRGTVTGVNGTFQSSIFIGNAFSPTSGSSISAAVYSNAAWTAPSGQTIGTAATFLATLNANTNVGTISNLYGVYTVSGTIAGTVGAAYGGYFNDSPSGASGGSMALFAANMAIGYNSISLHGTNNFLVAGQSAFGSSTVDSTASIYVAVNNAFSKGFSIGGAINGVSSSFQAGIYMANNFNPSTGSANSTAFYANSVWTAPSGQTISIGSSFLSTMNAASNIGTISNIIGFYGTVSGGSFTGTVVNAYGAYFPDCPAGQTAASMALFSANMSIGDAGLNLRGTNDLHVAGKTVTATFQLTTSPTSGYVLTADSSGNGTWTASGGVTTIGAFGGGTPSTNGLSISGLTLYAQAASGTVPGMVTTGPQTFGGDKTVPTLIATSGIQTAAFRLTASNVLSYVLTSDANGNGSWVQTQPPIANVGAADADITYVMGNLQYNIVNPTTNRNYTLPTTSVPAGSIWIFKNRSGNSCTIKASDGTTIGTLGNGAKLECASLIAVPVTHTDWISY